MRTANDRGRAGVAAICIEDSAYPNRCSFYAGIQRELISIEMHCGKIRAAKAVQSFPEFMVIASRQYRFSRGGWKPIPLKSIKRSGPRSGSHSLHQYGIQSPITALRVGASFVSHD
jgi:2-methylisocitrate lyase-like PEP mutase family enzyme